ncbi:hypothetical protein LSH36_49g06064 [Paralvinella palmiformis]|uniref:Actin-related protein 2/3 complex subunit 5 n=1 Tax=Paralvinella palmiformis TaxID=53620 RepID=A0AAD9K690_9ANNE|nr:hypothetical protein LSH36_49g06064 [Paralvinella palmiformis]
MSKNTRDAKFRAIDVDKYDENNYIDEETEDVQSGPNESEVIKHLNAARNEEALKLVLTNPPLATKNQAIKDKCFQLVMRVLTSFRTSDMDSAIKTLDQQKIDTLMKYIYRGFETPSEKTCSLLLAWHERAVAAGGLGSIMRVLTDRKHV